MKKKKWMMMAVMVLALTMMFGTTVYASGKGDVAGAIEGTWQDGLFKNSHSFLLLQNAVPLL